MEPSTSQLVKMLRQLPLSNSLRFMAYLNYTSLIELIMTCRLTYITIRNNPHLWKYLYDYIFLSGPYGMKEWDFLYWCARSNWSTSEIPLTSEALLDRLDWYDVYRRRVLTEKNWQAGHFKYNALKPADDSKALNERQFRAEAGTAVIVSMVKRVNRDTTQYVLAGIESNGAVQNIDVASTDYPDMVAMSEWCNERDIDDNECTEALTDRFAIVLGKCRGNKYVNVYTRGNYKLHRCIPIATDLKLISARGQWAFFINNSKGFWGPFDQLLIYDLENNQKYTTPFTQEQHTICIYKATTSYVIFFTARLTSNMSGGCVEWTFYKVLQSGNVVQLQSNQIHMSSDVTRINAWSCDYFYVQLDAYVREKRESQYVYLISFRNKHDTNVAYDHYLHRSFTRYSHCNIEYYDCIFKDIKTKVVEPYIEWSSVYRYSHLIGDIFVVYQDSNTGFNAFLLDIERGRIIRGANCFFSKSCRSLTTGIALLSSVGFLTMWEYGAR